MRSICSRADSTDLLQHLAALTDQNSLLAFALAIDRRRNPREPRAFLEIVDDHRGRVGNFFARYSAALLADNFRRHEPRRLIGDLILGKICRARGQSRDHHIQKRVEPLRLSAEIGITSLKS